MMPWSLIPLLHACAFGVAAVAARVLLSYHRTGVSPFAFARNDAARQFTGRWFYLWLPLVDFMFVVFHAWTDNPGPLLWEGLAQREEIRWLGGVLLAVSLVWVVLAQGGMGRSWKMGVDDAEEGELCTSGLFAYSRHPVYTGIRVTMFAQLLVIGSWPALCLWMVSEMLVQLQARFEEDAMEAVHGVVYERYSARVRRWL